MRALAVFLVAVASACSAAGASGSAAAPSPSLASTASPSPSPTWTADPAHVFRARPGTPDGAEPCRDQVEVEAALRRFAAVFNSGEPASIRADLSPEFWAFSIGVRGHHQVAYTRDDAVRFIVERHAAGDRLEFRRVQVNGLVGWDGAAHIGPVDFVLTRGGMTEQLSGKGALYCGGGVRGIKVLGLVSN